MDLSHIVVEVEHRFGAPPEAVFDLLTDIERMAGLGPEHHTARWLDNDHTRFAGENTLGEREWEVLCVVIAKERPRSFGWSVGEPEDPSSTWTYDLVPDGEATLVRQRFQLGPGRTLLSGAMRKYPEQAEQILDARTAQLSANMLTVLRAAERLLLGA